MYCLLVVCFAILAVACCDLGLAGLLYYTLFVILCDVFGFVFAGGWYVLLILVCSGGFIVFVSGGRVCYGFAVFVRELRCVGFVSV